MAFETDAPELQVTAGQNSIRGVPRHYRKGRTGYDA
jgi:hypothetical protein